jgi:hypothetical protein
LRHFAHRPGIGSARVKAAQSLRNTGPRWRLAYAFAGTADVS